MKNFSILGYGHIGKVHEQAIKSSENANLIGIIDFELPSDLDVKGYTALESFLNEDTETDVVVIATPNGLHREHAIRCLKGGKNVLIEKPLALTKEDAEEILAVAKEKNLRVFSSMQLRFSPVVQYVKKLIDNNALGKIHLINIHCFWNRNKAYYKMKDWHGTDHLDGGVLFTQFSHFIDVLNFWFDEVNCVSSKSFNFNHTDVTDFDDSGFVEFTTNQAVGHMTYSTSVFNKNFESTISIIAEKGTIKIGGQYINEMLYSDLKNICCSQNISTEQKNFHFELIEEVSDALMRHNPSILDAEEAVNLVKFIEEATIMANENKLKSKDYEISHA